MKNIIERIAGGGAKIATYLSIAVKSRLAGAALAALAAGGAWATDSLEETGGFITDTSTLAFKGVSLSELTADTLSGRFGGAGAGTASGTFATFNNFDRSSEGSGSISCEAQVADDGWVKGVILTFTQSGEDVYVVKTAGKYKSGSAVGPSVSDGTSENSSYPYAIYNLALPRTGYGAATVVWEKGQFGLTKTGTDGNSYSFSNIDGTGNVAINASGAIEVSSGATKGAIVALPSGAVNVAVLVKYSGLAAKNGVTPVCMYDNGSVNMGVITTNASTHVKGYFGTDSRKFPQRTDAFVTMPEGSGYFLSSYNCRYATPFYQFYAGSTMNALTGGNCDGLRFTANNKSISYIAVGGPVVTGTSASPWDGLVIEKVAIYVVETQSSNGWSTSNPYTNTDVANYYWPSVAATDYLKWNYAAAGRVVTWKSLPDASLDSGTGQKITVAGTTYGVFDTHSGSDTGTYTGGATSNSGAHWNYFCIGKSVYSAPGSVMRFVASDTYAHNVRADFSPLTIGGIIVESGATGYTIAEDASNSRKDNRAVILGDQPASGQETWFRFNEDFTFGRQGALVFVGSVNINVAAGKTVTVTEKVNSSSEIFVPKVCSSVAVNSDGSGALSTLTAGGTLRLHGLGKIASTAGLDASSATLDYTDLAATSSTAADAYIQGTLTVNDSTVIALPAGATFPYFVASAASGTLDPANGVTIGGVSAPGYKLKSDGSVVAPRTVTISGNETWGSGTLNGWPTDDSTEGYAITVTADATLTLPSAVSCDVLSITVEDGVTLTISGEYTITAEEAIFINGLGKVIAAAAGSFSGDIKGDGTVQYPSKTLPTGATWTNDEWKGTLIIVQCGNGNNNSHGYVDFTSYGSDYSFIKATLFAGYTTQSTTANDKYCAATLVIDEGDTFTLNNGDSGKSCVFKALSGSGTLALSGSGTATTQYIFRDVSKFTGSVTVSDNANKSIVLGASSSWTPNFSDYRKKLVIAGDVTIAARKTWTADSGIADSGIVNNGTITLNGALSGTITGSGTVECGQGVDLTGSGFDNSAKWTGTVRLNGDAAIPTTPYDESSYGNASSTLEIVSGAVGITAAATLPGTVNVASGATLWYGNPSATELTLAGSNSGTINLSTATSLTTLTLNLTGNGSIVYPSSLTTLNVTYTESLADDGVKAFTVNGATFAGGTMTLTRPDGTTESVTGTADGNTLSFEWTPAVSGAACWCAYEMEYESGVKTGFENSGSDNSGLNSDSDIEGIDAFTDDGMLYTYAHPWRDITYPTDGNWTAVVRCTVPAYENAAVITFGTCNGGLIGLVAGADPETQMKLVKTTGNSAFTTLATMTVQNATTAQHVYVFSVENNQTIKVYCDGEQVLNETYSTFTLGGGIQVGSVHGGINATGIVRFAKNESPANTLSETVQKAARIDCVRLYKTALGPNAIAQLSVEFPAVKLYRATVAANATTTWDVLTWSPAWDGGNEYSKIILTAAGDGTLTLPESIKADEFTIDVESGCTLTLAKAAGDTAMTVSKLEIDDGTVAVADANFFGGRAINGTGTLKITGSGLLTSALSGNAKVKIPSGIAVGVMTGSIANPITGAGTLAYQNALPATFPSFSGWTGTVQLPAIATDVAINFNNYGIAGSTVAITSMTAGWIENAEVLPEINLVGNMTLNHFSGNWVNTFDKLSGAGTFTLAADGTANDYVDNYFLVKDVSDFTGSISVAAPGLAIGASKPASPTTYGQIYITTPVTVGSSAKWTAQNGVVLGDSNATLTVPTSASVPVPTTSVADSYVKATTGESTTVYSVAAKRTATVSVGTNASLSINGNPVADGDTVKFVPGDVLTIAASADTYYTPALTVNSVAQTSPYQLTTTDADVTVSATATRDTVAITIPSVANTTVSVSYTSGGAAQVATTAGDITVDAGTDVTATWTAASGYKITSGASQTLNAVTSAQTLAPPTVEAKGATVSGVTFSYLDDFAKATVTATVTGDATSATLNYGGAQYVAEVGSGGSVTFDNVVVTRGADIYAPVDYTIDTDAHTTTGRAGKTIAADVYGWITEDKGNYEATGTWETDIAYDGDNTAVVTDNKYTPTSPSSNDVVTITVKNVVYPELSDETEILTDAQAAICLGTNSASTIVFKVLVTNGTDVAHWAEASGVTANTNRAYDIALTFDYTKGTYSATVNGSALTVAGATSWGLCKSATSVSNIEFMGAGSITGIHGVVLEGNMIEDGKGNKYATIQAAIDALTADATLAPLTKLHAGTPPEGWRFDGNTLIKIAKGMFFFAF